MNEDELRALWLPRDTKPIPLDTGELNFRTVNDLNNIIKRNLNRLQGLFDLIVGIPRSGLTPGVLISLYLNLPFLSINEYLDNSFESLSFTMRKGLSHRRMLEGPSGARILVVDDSVNTGNAMGLAKEKILATRAADNHDVKYLAIFAATNPNNHVDFVLDICRHPRIFEWNMMHHALVSSFIFDLDGILCVDGPPEVSDDGGRYENYILSAVPKFIPSGRLGAIVTSRLEKYRPHTEKWLNENGITYSQLVMLNVPSAERRREIAVYGRYKADAYNMLGGRLFVESEEWQARDIHRITKKPVFCPDIGLFLGSTL
jgi:hypoxanthine phosphoribosyltransferase